MLVSIVISARSWDPYLEATLATISSQCLPSGVTTEVLVALGDGAPPSAPRGVVVVANPSRTIPDGLNLAIAASSGGIILRVDARCDLPRHYVARVVDRLNDPAVGCVGGAALVLDRGLFGSSYAVAFNSPLLGPTVYRYRRTSGAVDTAYLGSWRRAELAELGGFDTRLIRNQDNELADRVRSSGKIVWYDAELVAGYHNTRGLLATLSHHHDFGMWRMIQRGHGQRALTGRHLVALSGAAAVVLGGVGALSSRQTRRFALACAAGAYTAAAAVAWRTATGLRQARPDIVGPPFNPLAPLLAPALAVVLDGAWLAGLVRGAARSRRQGAGRA